MNVDYSIFVLEESNITKNILSKKKFQPTTQQVFKQLWLCIFWRNLFKRWCTSRRPRNCSIQHSELKSKKMCTLSLGKPYCLPEMITSMFFEKISNVSLWRRHYLLHYFSIFSTRFNTKCCWWWHVVSHVNCRKSFLVAFLKTFFYTRCRKTRDKALVFSHCKIKITFEL